MTYCHFSLWTLLIAAFLITHVASASQLDSNDNDNHPDHLDHPDHPDQPDHVSADSSLNEFLDSCFSPPSLCYYLLLVPSVVVVFTGLCCSKWVGYMFFKHN